MHSLTILLLTLAYLVLNVSGASLPGTPLSPGRRLHFVVPRTLQGPAANLVSRNELNKRQCPGGENCIDGGCCPAGYQCVGAFTADSGCCPTGHTCSGTPVGCADPSLVSCPGINACCATLGQCPSSANQSCNDTTPPPPNTTPTTTYTPPPTTYTPPTITYTPPAVTQTAPTVTYTPPTTQTTGGASDAAVQPTVTVNPLRNGAGTVRVVMGEAMAVVMGALALLA